MALDALEPEGACGDLVFGGLDAGLLVVVRLFALQGGDELPELGVTSKALFLDLEVTSSQVLWSQVASKSSFLEERILVPVRYFQREFA